MARGKLTVGLATMAVSIGLPTKMAKARPQQTQVGEGPRFAVDLRNAVNRKFATDLVNPRLLKKINIVA